jgi:hypothetical protein
MDMQTSKVDSVNLPAQNFAVVALQRRVFARSNISAVFINKESQNYSPESDPLAPVYSRYNRNIGLEYNLASSNNLWTGKALFLKSISPDQSSRAYVHAVNLLYASKKWNIGWQHEYVGRGYKAEVGYVPRTGFIRFNPQISYLIFPNGTKVLSHGPKLNTSHFFNESLEETDHEDVLQYAITFRNQRSLTGWISNNYVKLLRPFDPTNSGQDTLATGSEHRWNAFGIDFISKPQQLLTYAFSGRYGGYYADGTRFNFTSEVGYRFQPYVSIAISSSYNDIRLPQPWNRNTFWLVGPRLDVTLTNKLFFTAFGQYNEQLDNVNLNTRLQWRYSPASDLFIVYTDNYLPENFHVKNRALVVKFTYWWNL